MKFSKPTAVCILLKTTLLFFNLVVLSSGQTAKPSTLIDELTPIIYPQPNRLTALLNSPITFSWQTPVQIHHTLILAVSFREPYAACHPKALSFFGTKDKIEKSLCSPLNKAKIGALVFYYVTLTCYPVQSAEFRALLESYGVPPKPYETSYNTIDGWAQRSARRVIKFFTHDGWNSLGNDGRKSKTFPQRYADTIGYKPKNHADMSFSKLRFPLRWQPRTYEDDEYGYFVSQNHITPHIGKTVKPLTMSMNRWNSKTMRTKGFYNCPNRKFSVCRKDQKLIRKKYMPDMLRAMRLVSGNRTKLFRAWWWDNKFISAGLYRPFYEITNGISQQDGIFSGLGELMAFHDSTLIAWREKLRFDYARPEAILKRLYRKRKYVYSWRGPKKSAGRIPINEWQPVVPTMPHSEYPSGSASICSAVLGFVELRMKYSLGKDFEIPPLNISYPHRNFPNIPVDGPINLLYKKIRDGIMDCGMSRIDAGLHFQPAVDEGNRLGDIIAKTTFKTWVNIEEGRKPKHCHWCMELDK